MTEITTVRLEDIHRRPNARPLDSKLVDKIAESIRLIGFRPSEPLTLKRDGDIYWCVDGDHRKAGAALAGIEEVPAVIEDLDDAGVLTYEGSLNLQRPDTEQERWARAQQFFALGEGASPRQIVVATGIDSASQVKAQRVLAKLSDPIAAEDLTFEQALAAHAFIDDDEAFGAVMNAGANWQQVADSIERERRIIELRAEAERVIAESGCELVTEVKHGEMRYLRQTSADGPAHENAKFARIEAYSHGVMIWWYGDYAEAEAADPEADAKREAEDRRRAELNAAQARRFEFIREYLDGVFDDDRLSPALLRFAETTWETPDSDGDYRYIGAAEIAEALVELEGFMPRVYAAILSSVEDDIRGVLENPVGWNLSHYGALTVAYFEALSASGYQPSEAETAALAAITEALTPEDDDDAPASVDESDPERTIMDAVPALEDTAPLPPVAPIAEPLSFDLPRRVFGENDVPEMPGFLDDVTGSVRPRPMPLLEQVEGWE